MRFFFIFTEVYNKKHSKPFLTALKTFQSNTVSFQYITPLLDYATKPTRYYDEAQILVYWSVCSISYNSIVLSCPEMNAEIISL